MFPALKRTLLMPFIERNRKKKLWKDIRAPEEVLKEMKHFHELSMECEKRGKKDLAKEYQVMEDALKWVLRIDGGNTK